METRKADFIHFRLTWGERQALEQMAQKEDVNVSEMLRVLVREAAKSKLGIPAVGCVNQGQQVQPY